MDACARFPAAPHRVRVLMDSAGELAIEATLREPEVSIRVGVADRPIDRSHPFLYYKTTRRQVYEEAQRAGFDDVLLYNESREITESCRANVVIEIAGRKLTPPVRCGLLGGTFRAHLLDRGEIEEDVVQVEQLGAADRVWLINSVRKWIDIDLVL